MSNRHRQEFRIEHWSILSLVYCIRGPWGARVFESVSPLSPWGATGTLSCLMGDSWHWRGHSGITHSHTDAWTYWQTDADVPQIQIAHIDDYGNAQWHRWCSIFINCQIALALYWPLVWFVVTTISWLQRLQHLQHHSFFPSRMEDGWPSPTSSVSGFGFGASMLKVEKQTADCFFWWCKLLRPR